MLSYLQEYKEYIIVFILLFILFLFRKNREGFTSENTPDAILASIKSANNQLTDTLLISKYKSSYEDLIIALDDWANMNMINILINGKVGTSILDMESITQYNALADFKKKLNDSMTYIDK